MGFFDKVKNFVENAADGDIGNFNSPSSSGNPVAPLGGNPLSRENSNPNNGNNFSNNGGFSANNGSPFGGSGNNFSNTGNNFSNNGNNFSNNGNNFSNNGNNFSNNGNNFTNNPAPQQQNFGNGSNFGNSQTQQQGTSQQQGFFKNLGNKLGVGGAATGAASTNPFGPSGPSATNPFNNNGGSSNPFGTRFPDRNAYMDENPFAPKQSVANARGARKTNPFAPIEQPKEEGVSSVSKTNADGQSFSRGAALTDKVQGYVPPSSEIDKVIGPMHFPIRAGVKDYNETAQPAGMSPTGEPATMTLATWTNKNVDGYTYTSRVSFQDMGMSELADMNFSALMTSLGTTPESSRSSRRRDTPRIELTEEEQKLANEAKNAYLDAHTEVGRYQSKRDFVSWIAAVHTAFYQAVMDDINTGKIGSTQADKALVGCQEDAKAFLEGYAKELQAGSEELPSTANLSSDKLRKYLDDAGECYRPHRCFGFEVDDALELLRADSVIIRAKKYGYSSDVEIAERVADYAEARSLSYQDPERAEGMAKATKEAAESMLTETKAFLDEFIEFKGKFNFDKRNKMFGALGNAFKMFSNQTIMKKFELINIEIQRFSEEAAQAFEAAINKRIKDLNELIAMHTQYKSGIVKSTQSNGIELGKKASVSRINGVTALSVREFTMSHEYVYTIFATKGSYSYAAGLVMSLPSFEKAQEVYDREHSRAVEVEKSKVHAIRSPDELEEYGKACVSEATARKSSYEGILQREQARVNTLIAKANEDAKAFQELQMKTDAIDETAMKQLQEVYLKAQMSTYAAQQADAGLKLIKKDIEQAQDDIGTAKSYDRLAKYESLFSTYNRLVQEAIEYCDKTLPEFFGRFKFE